MKCLFDTVHRVSETYQRVKVLFLLWDVLSKTNLLLTAILFHIPRLVSHLHCLEVKDSVRGREVKGGQQI